MIKLSNVSEALVEDIAKRVVAKVYQVAGNSKVVEMEEVEPQESTPVRERKRKD